MVPLTSLGNANLPVVLASKSSRVQIPVMIRPTHVEALPGYRIHLKYSDGAEGDIDLSANVGRGVFTALSDEAFFRTVHLGHHGQIAWSEEIEICGDSAYDEIVAKPALTSNARD